MRQKIKNVIMVLAATFMFGAPALVPAVASAQSIKDSICEGTNVATSGAGASKQCDETNSTNANGLYDIAQKVVNIFSILVGVIAVLMIIFAGFKYITSGGDSSNVSGAKNALIYAIVGLVIVALAQFIVHFVINNADSAVKGTDTGIMIHLVK